METKIIWTCVVMLITSCNTNSTLSSSEKIQNQWYIGLSDTTLIEYRNDIYVAYTLHGDTTYSISWGRGDTLLNTSTANFSVLGNGVLGVLDIDDNALILQQSIGISCSYYVILPLTKNAKEKVYYEVKAYDLSNHIVAYIPSDENVFLRIENTKTGKYQDINEDNLCPAANKGDCIDTIIFHKNQLIIKWQGSKCSNIPDTQKRTIPLTVQSPE